MLLLWLMPMNAWSQSAISSPTVMKSGKYSLEQHNDTLYTLTLTTDSTSDQWQIPYPVYRFCSGDVDGDGSEDALVGVVKTTRYFPEKGNRIFIFKNYHGLIRPLWLGSKLGGILDDFRFVDGRVRSLERTTDGQYVVAVYRWAHFGLGFDRFIVRNVSYDEAMTVFNEK
jgi:hypothetical protein